MKWQRYLQAEDMEEENFWPSFADIMMLIVMIFLLVMVVLMIKNSDLVIQLKNSILAEQKVSATAQLAEEKNESLAAQLESRDQTISSLRLRLMDMEAEKESSAMLLESFRLSNEDLRGELVAREQVISSLDSKLEGANQQISNLDSEVRRQELTINDLQGSIKRQELDYLSLKDKYQKLLRPARSPKGKVVLEVSLLQNTNSQTIRLKTPEAPVRVVSEQELHRILSGYKSKTPNGLYLKIIFPEGGTISHQDAWSFTSGLLQKYDYYYQGNP
ncbi:MAG: hypothetical protein HRU19_26390 [Pseudobacteriovorax sp.]|nr:hypothetical protein [Pseudobacteriovorax sp.]